MIVPPALEAGDRVAVVSPSGPILDARRLDEGLEVLRGWGLEPVLMPHVRQRHGHLAGTDEQRERDLGAAFRDPAIRAVFAARGGYGVTRILDRLDWDALADDPIPLVGFSDVTALLLAAWRRLRLVTVHGPSVSSLREAGTDAAAHLRAMLFDAPSGPGDAGTRVVADGRCLVPGRAEGPLLGGNLSLLTSLLGTADAPETDGAVLLLEDVGEAPYRIDRMLTHLRRAGLLDRVAGVAVGGFTRCEPPPGRPSRTLEEVLADALGDLGVPVVAGLPIGHVPGNRAVPLGATVRLDADEGTLVLLEPAVAARGRRARR